MLGVEAIRTAQAKFGKKPLTREQVRWGLEGLDLTADRTKHLGFEGVRNHPRDSRGGYDIDDWDFGLTRLIGRIAHGLGPWQLSGIRQGAARVLVRTIWCEKWQSTEQRLAELEAILRRLGAVAERGGHFDSWDLNIRGGLVGSVRALAMVEEHGGGKQLFRVRAWTTVSMLGFLIPVSFTVLAIFAALDDAWVAASVASVGALALALSAYADCATAMKMWSQVVEEYASSGR